MPVRHVTVSTATGTFPSTGWVDFGGDSYRFMSYADDRTESDKDIKGKIEGSLGGSNKWVELVALTTDSTGTIFATTGTKDFTQFDKARLIVSTNNSTSEFGAWIAAGD